MNTELTELVFILDRSGSMGGLESDTIGGFNGMIAKQKEQEKKLLIDIRERATDRQIRSVKEVLKDYFGYSLSSDDDDTIMKSFKNKAQDNIWNSEVFRVSIIG